MNLGRVLLGAVVTACVSASAVAQQSVQVSLPNDTHGMRNGYAVAATTANGLVTGDDILLVVSGPSFRVSEVYPDLDIPVQPIPAGCYDTQAGEWPEGAVYILGYDATAGTWTTHQTITPDLFDPDLLGQTGFAQPFGTSLSISSDGSVIVIGLAGPANVAAKDFIGIDCNPDAEALPGEIVPEGRLYMLAHNGATWQPITASETTNPNAISVFHNGTLQTTLATAEVAGNALTLILTDGLAAGTYVYDFTQPEYDTLGELADAINAEGEDGFTVNFPDIGDGTTGATVDLAGITFTLTVIGGPNGGTYPFDLTDTDYDTFTELVAAINGLGVGFVADLGLTNGTIASTTLYPVTAENCFAATTATLGYSYGFVAQLLGDAADPSIDIQDLTQADCFGIANIQVLQYTATDSAPLELTGPRSGMPQSACACDDDESRAVVQNGIGASSSILELANGDIIVVAGMPWYDGNGAYPSFIYNGDSIVLAGDVTGTCVTEDAVFAATGADCADAGGILFDDVAGSITGPGPVACCFEDDCVQMPSGPWDCVVVGGSPVSGLSCEDDQPCPSDVTRAVPPSDTATPFDPTSCGRGGGFLVKLTPPALPGGEYTAERVSGAINNATGDPIVSANYGVGLLGLIPDNLAAGTDPFPHQVMGTSIAAVEHDGQVWVFIGAPGTGGVTGFIDAECSQLADIDLDINDPELLNGRVLVYTLDTATMQVAYMETLVGMANFEAFGTSIAVTGNQLAIGAPWAQRDTVDDDDTGSVYVYTYDVATSTWGANAPVELIMTDGENADMFGSSLAFAGTQLAVGAPKHTTATGAGSGAVVLFNNVGAPDWQERETITPPTLNFGAPYNNPNLQAFGSSLAFAQGEFGTAVIAGAPRMGVFNAAPVISGAVGMHVFNGVAAACDGDFDGNQQVDVLDLIHLLRGMGRPAISPECDLNDDGAVNAVDIIRLVDGWGGCEG